MATCLHASPDKIRTKREANGADMAPACVYTREQLRRLVDAFSPELQAYGYTVPAACADVWAGTAEGGTDAMPPSPKTSAEAAAERKYRIRRCQYKAAMYPRMCTAEYLKAQVSTGAFNGTGSREGDPWPRQAAC